MARKETITIQTILDTAFAMTREEGFANVTARKVAAKAGCSTQPIFRVYKNMEEEANRHMLRQAMKHLSAREKVIIDLRFGLNSLDGKEKTQKEVADMLGISQSYISRLEKKIMKRLKSEILKFG